MKVLLWGHEYCQILSQLVFNPCHIITNEETLDHEEHICLLFFILQDDTLFFAWVIDINKILNS